MRTAISKLRFTDHLIGIGLMIAYVVLLMKTAGDIGMSRDESFYVDAAQLYAHWFELLFRNPSEAFTQAAIDASWTYNGEHPSLPKSLFALSWIAQQKYHLFSTDSMAFRFPGMVMSAACLWILYIFGAQLYGRLAGFLGALFYAAIPAIFYHSHLNCFDTPIVTMLMWTSYAYYQSLTKVGWRIALGFVYGLCLATKHNAWILPGVFVVHFAFLAVSEIAHRRAGGIKRVSIVPWWILSMGTIGPVLFVALWPRLWYETFERFNWYASFHLHHDYYNIEYLGKTYFGPPVTPSPASYAFVTSAMTFPLTTLVLGLVGLAMRFPRVVPPPFNRWIPTSLQPDFRLTDTFVFGCFFAPLAIFCLPSTPIFGGTKHFITAWAIFALYAGYAAAGIIHFAQAQLQNTRWFPKWASAGKRETAIAWALPLAISALFLAPSLRETAHSHPFGLSHYGFLAGGAPGAADLGMNRQFWGFTTGSLVPWMNERLPPGTSIWIHDTTWTAFSMLQRDGLLRADLRAAGSLRDADVSLVHHEHHFAEVDTQLWQTYGRPDPVHVMNYDGVPIISVYANPRGRAASLLMPSR